MKLQKLLSYTRRAIDTYQMIDDGDKIAVCISGGKDSMLLALHQISQSGAHDMVLNSVNHHW